MRALKPPQRLKLGQQVENKGKPVYIDQKNRSTHMHIIGSTGEGKSKFMEHMIREDIINNNGICLIDPHGYLYNDIVRWCETKGMLDRARPKKIILFDPGEENWTFGFNPLQVSSTDISFHVDAMVKATAKVWGDEDTDRTPLLKRCLRVLFHALAEKQLSLLEAQYLINPVGEKVRKYLTHDIKDRTIKEQWDYFNILKPKPFYDEFGSTINRMMEFLSAPVIRSIIGQTEKTLNFREIMDAGYILLINLASKDKISEDNAKLLGALIVNDLFMKARGRPEGSRPFYVYIDECARYINEDIARILDEGRKFGLHLILAHQHLEQLRKAGDDVYHSVMTDAKTKVIFGGLSAEDTEILAKQVFLGELDLEEAKTSLDKPTVVRYVKTWLKNYSDGTSHSEGVSDSAGEGISNISTNLESQATIPSQQFLGEDQIITTIGRTSGFGAMHSSSSGTSSSDTETHSQGASETFVPELEDRPGQVFSLQEQIYKSMAVMVNQPTQHAIIKLPKKQTKVVKTPTIKAGCARDERVERFKDQCYKLSDFTKPALVVQKQIAERQLLLEQAASPDPEEPESFRE